MSLDQRALHDERQVPEEGLRTCSSDSCQYKSLYQVRHFPTRKHKVAFLQAVGRYLKHQHKNMGITTLNGTELTEDSSLHSQLLTTVQMEIDNDK